MYSQRKKWCPLQLYHLVAADTNVWYLQAHVPCHLNHVSEQTSAQYGLVDTRMRTQGFSIWLPIHNSSVTYISTGPSYTVIRRDADPPYILASETAQVAQVSQAHVGLVVQVSQAHGGLKVQESQAYAGLLEQVSQPTGGGNTILLPIF